MIKRRQPPNRGSSWRPSFLSRIKYWRKSVRSRKLRRRRKKRPMTQP